MLTQTFYYCLSSVYVHHRHVSKANSLFIKANIMAGVHIIVYIEAKINSNNNVGCAVK